MDEVIYHENIIKGYSEVYGGLQRHFTGMAKHLENHLSRRHTRSNPRVSFYITSMSKPEEPLVLTFFSLDEVENDIYRVIITLHKIGDSSTRPYFRLEVREVFGLSYLFPTGFSSLAWEAMVIKNSGMVIYKEEFGMEKVK